MAATITAVENKIALAISFPGTKVMRSFPNMNIKKHRPNTM